MSAESEVVVALKETDEVFANPNIGWQTFHRFADEDKNLEGLPSSSAYFRFYWSEVEPVEGQIDFPMFDKVLARARKAGQKLAFRIMCAGTSEQYLYVPKWLKDMGCRGFEYQYQGQGPKHWVPDMDDPIFQKYHFRLIKELGKRYEGHPDLDLVDIGSVGLWGEWHMGGTGVSIPSVQSRLAIIKAWCEAFPGTPKVMLLNELEGLKYAAANGCGWRADCLGDMGGFSKMWSHMKDFYPLQIQKAGVQDAWKTAPVAFESCWDMRKWVKEGWDVRYIFDFALNVHASYVNNKSAPIPEGTREEIERLLRRMGYRLVLRELRHAKAAKRGRPFSLSMIWENVGVAPPYRDYMLGFQLVDVKNRSNAYEFMGKNSIKGWLPGKKEVVETINIPRETNPGLHGLAVAIVDAATKKPSIRLAIDWHTRDGWYPLSQIEIT